MAIETLRPNAAGDEENIDEVIGDGVGTHYTVVDEETPDGDATRVLTDNATYLRDLYNIADHSVGSGTINHITVYANCKAALAPDQASLKIAFKSGTGTGAPDTVSESSELTLTTEYTDYSNQWSTNPATSSAWTWDEIDKLQAGISLRRCKATFAHSRCTQVYVVVDYTTDGATPKTSSDIGSGTDAYVSLQTPAAKSSSDAGSGVEGTPMPSAILAGSETGSGIEALVARLLAAVDTGCGVEVVVEVGGLFKNLFATELGEGSDLLTAKIEMPTKGGGMKLWT